jgi:hypothetical protein
MLSLIECAEVLIGSPTCLAFLEAWQRWRGHELMPSADQVIPEELGKTINNLSILEAHSQDRITVRLQGAATIEVTGQDLTGKELSSILPKETWSQARDRCWNYVTVPCGAIVDLTYVRASGATFPTRRLMLPVLPKSPEEPKRIYVATEAYGERTKPYEPPPSPVGMVEQFTYVDIGCGAPE